MRIGILAVLLAALAIAACGGDDNDGGLLSGARQTNGASGNPGVQAMTVVAGGAPVTGNTTATPDACAVLTKADAEAVTRKPMKDGQDKTSRENVMGSRECEYYPVATNDDTSLRVLVISTAGLSEPIRRSGHSAKAQFEGLKNGPQGRNATRVTGIGDDAFITNAMLYAIKGNVYFDVTLLSSNINGAALTDALKTAGTRVAAKLP